MTKNLKAAIFDLDGVIVDTAKYHFLAWKRMANSLGFDFSEEQNEQLKGVSRMESLDRILAWGRISLDQAEKDRYAAKKNDWYLDYIREMTPAEILPGVTAFLGELQATGIKMAIGSSSRNAMTIIDRIGLGSFFDTIVDGNRISKSKPDPEVFLKAADDLGVEPGLSLVFEDAEAGVEAALRGGFHVIGIGSPEVLGAADAVIPSLGGYSWPGLTALLR